METLPEAKVSVVGPVAEVRSELPRVAESASEEATLGKGAENKWQLTPEEAEELERFGLAAEDKTKIQKFIEDGPEGRFLFAYRCPFPNRNDLAEFALNAWLKRGCDNQLQVEVGKYIKLMSVFGKTIETHRQEWYGAFMRTCKLLR